MSEYNIDDLKPGDRVRFEHEDGTVIVGEVKKIPSGRYQVKGSALTIPVYVLTERGFTLAHVEPATPPLPEEPPVGSVVRWKRGKSHVGSWASWRRSYAVDGWYTGEERFTWAELNKYGTPELLVSRTELVNEIANWVRTSGAHGRINLADDIRERFLP